MALFNVTNLFDSGIGSLRQAILDANSTAGDDEIQFSSISGTITLTSGELNITDSLTINGIGADLLTISGNNASEVFDIDDGTSNVINVYLNGLTISNGYDYGIVNQDSLTITNSQISNNDINISNSGVVTLTNSQISDSYRSGISNSGMMTITNSQISDSYRSGISNSGVMTITNSTISENGSTYTNGGGIYNSGKLTITNTKISQNVASFGGSALSRRGGGILNEGDTTIINSTISGNRANYGGGIESLNGTVIIIDSTISGNVSRYGGGINNGSSSTAIISNSTVSGNSADYYGGGLRSTGKLIITNSTISGNKAYYSDGGLLNFNKLIITNSIIANNSGGDCFNNGTITTNINNLIEDGSCNPALSGDPNLGPLQDNGGPTFTQALLLGSIAIDAGDNAAIPPDILTDQRGAGFPRIINGTVDIGAYEASQNVPPSVPEPSSLFGIITLGLAAIGSLRRRRK
ncbi:hypothetical protein C7H19_21560 [Aphanothece hegewaldii CCALA 016]|uniref:Ice-binding protein C-terminal domain-containing protein n=1 Tax=Aphanothece hegewaldii CCALA 016 TaxID=2107694 RepID=A0A2T1LS90_9CHRO|nr:choice-of-anchor Q domain-containing protein [Aphanothece hegewaldii]PSF32484.1 hypothetical protein C7H19_21560 [Aphanothece hegewaldii CCALA 016]